MRRIVSIATGLALILSLGACARPMEICGSTYVPFGLANDNEMRNPRIEYQIVWGNAIFGIVLFETVIAPIYFFGFSLFEPVGVKGSEKGTKAQSSACPVAKDPAV